MPQPGPSTGHPSLWIDWITCHWRPYHGSQHLAQLTNKRGGMMPYSNFKNQPSSAFITACNWWVIQFKSTPYWVAIDQTCPKPVKWLNLWRCQSNFRAIWCICPNYWMIFVRRALACQPATMNTPRSHTDVDKHDQLPSRWQMWAIIIADTWMCKKEFLLPKYTAAAGWVHPVGHVIITARGNAATGVDCHSHSVVCHQHRSKSNAVFLTDVRQVGGE